MDDNLEQEIGFRIWNRGKSAILLYLFSRSVTWTLPTVQHENHENIMEALHSHLPNIDIAAAICIVNAKDSVPTRAPGNIQFENVIHQYIIYDIVIKTEKLRRVEPPGNIRLSHFMSLSNVIALQHKTPILNHLIKHMKKEERQCHQIAL